MTPSETEYDAITTLESAYPFWKPQKLSEPSLADRKIKPWHRLRAVRRLALSRDRGTDQWVNLLVMATQDPQERIREEAVTALHHSRVVNRKLITVALHLMNVEKSEAARKWYFSMWKEDRSCVRRIVLHIAYQRYKSLPTATLIQ